MLTKVNKINKTNFLKFKMVAVDKEKCIGCGACVATCEAVFELKDNKVIVKKGQQKSKIPCVKEATDSCPVQAIKI